MQWPGMSSVKSSAHLHPPFPSGTNGPSGLQTHAPSTIISPFPSQAALGRGELNNGAGEDVGMGVGSSDADGVGLGDDSGVSPGTSTNFQR